MAPDDTLEPSSFVCISCCWALILCICSVIIMRSGYFNYDAVTAAT